MAAPTYRSTDLRYGATDLPKGGIGKSIWGSYPSCVRLRQLWLYGRASIIKKHGHWKALEILYIVGFSSLIRSYDKMISSGLLLNNNEIMIK